MRGIQAKKTGIIIGFACFVIILSGFFIHFNAKASNQEPEVSRGFTEIMRENNICISGSGGSLTKYAFLHLIEEIEDEAVFEKFECKMASSNKVTLTPEEIFEIDFYSRNESEREMLLKKIRNQKVDIQMEDEVILISYNPNLL